MTVKRRLVPGLVWALLPAVLIGQLRPSAGAAADQAQPFSRETPVVRAVRLAGPAVVNISTKEVLTRGGGPFRHYGGNDLFEQFFDEFFEPPQRRRVHQSLGSGVIIDGRRGFILTNEHVVSRATEINISLSDDREFIARLVGSDPDSDLAVLQIKTKEDLPALAMGDSSDLMIGETVIAIGNPYGLANTVTTGVVSAINRSIRTRTRVFRDFIQTDASINPGNSGGPLLNINGELIGINTAIHAEAEGIGFATPINKAKRIMKDLIHYGEVKPVWLGLNLQTIDDRLAKYFGAPSSRGVVITGLDPDGPAARSGLDKGDLLAGLGRYSIRSLDDYEDLLKGYTEGDQVELTVLRDKKKIKVKLTAQAFPQAKAEDISWRRYGLSVTLHPRSKKIVMVEKVRRGSPAERIGLRPGDFINRINEINIDSVDSYLKAMTRYRFRSGVSAVVQRGRQGYYITLAP